MASGNFTATANLDHNPGIEQHKVIVQNKCGEKLVGLLHETGSKGIVILCHGWMATKETSMMVELTAALEKQGITAFRFDFSGNGESEGTSGYGNYLKEVDDLRAVTQHFTALGRVITAILGHSKGGNVVILYASLHHDIPTVVNVSGRYKMDGSMETLMGKDYLERAKKDGFIDLIHEGKLYYHFTLEGIMNMHEAGLSIKKDCKVLTVHGSADELNLVEDSSEFAKIIPNHKLRIIEEANHNFDKHRDELVSTVLAFIKENLHTL